MFSTRCTCIKKGAGCTRRCRCICCKNSSSHTQSVQSPSKGCRCGISNKGDPTYKACIDLPTRKSKCPCLDQQSGCTDTCQCNNCNNHYGSNSASTTYTPKGKARRRAKHDNLQCSKGVDYLSEKGFQVKEGPWTSLETVTLLVIIEIIELN